MKYHLLPLLAVPLSFGAIASEQNSIRVGWQTTWAIQGQLVMALMHTPIGNHNNLGLEFNNFAFGGPLNQAAIGGEVDVVLTADQPALILLDRSDDFAIVGRMMHNRVCLYSPVGSEIDNVADLEGLRVSGPVGAAAERVALERMSNEGIDLNDVTFGNLDMAQQSALLIAAGEGASEWSGVDALYGFDPLPAEFVNKGYSKMLDCDRVVSVVMMRKSTILAEPEKAADFMCAFTTAWHQYAADKTLMNDLFLETSGLEVSHAVLDDAASLEPNFAAQKPEDFQFDILEPDLETFASANRFLVERGNLKEAVDLDMNIDRGPLQAALADPNCNALKAGVPYASNQ